MSTTFEAELPLTKIHAHPKNPRHAAAADDDMVASIRESGLLQPIVVAPHPDKAGQYVLIAGHRRLDGSKKAKRKTAPAVVRDDLVTEGQQIEAMIVENGHRLDLTPIEEAEGYAQLELLGYKQAAIAAAVGRNVKTIRARLGLLKLSKTTQSKVHEGQLTLEDAIAIGQFADDPETTKKLEKAAAGGSLRYELNLAKQRREDLAGVAARVARLIDAGAKPFEIPNGKDLWDLRRDGVLETINTRVYVDGGGWKDNDAAWVEHKGHLGYHEHARGGVPGCDVLCLDPASHAGAEDETMTAEERQREAEREESRQRYEAERVAKAAASDARTSTLLDLVGTATKVAPALRDLIRALLPYLLMHPECEDALTAYQKAVDVPEADRWTANWWGERADVNRTLALQHLAELNTLPDGKLVRGLVAALGGLAETYLQVFDSEEKIDLQLVGSYYDLLGEAGYVNAPPDVEIQDQLREAWAKLEDDPEPAAAS